VKEPQREPTVPGAILNAIDPLLRLYGEKVLPAATTRPRVRVVFNQKGGVGKTTLSVNLASCAALAGRRTLLIDADPNANTTTHLLGAGNRPGRTLADFYEGSLGLNLFPQTLADFITAPTAVKGLHLVAGDRRLDDLRPKLESRHKINRLRDGIPGVPYDQLFVDCPPVLDFFTLSCLIAADEVIVPIDCDSFSVQAAQQVQRAVAEIRQDHNPRLRLAGVVVNHFQKGTRHAAQMVAELHRVGLPVIEPFIPGSVKVRESHTRKQPLVAASADHPVARAIQGVFQALDA
jgi:chromosome partitioning protein